MTEVWTKWESQVINGSFPLRRFLSRSNHSVVFLTELKAQNLPDAAIKLVPADAALAEAQLAHWRMVATLSHPHLIRVFDSGRCQLGGHPFLFVVMEYAEQTLAQILPKRPLSMGEVSEMLPPTVDALAFLHQKKLVHGHLKPPNFLVVNDQLKLASDTIRPAGAYPAVTANASSYDPPEAKSGRISAAGDIWGLGTTLVEALTQHPPARSDEPFEIASLPAALPPEFVDTVRRCLSRNPVNRPTIVDLEAQIKGTPQVTEVSVPPPVVRESPRGVPEAPGQAAPSQQPPGKSLLVTAIVAVLILLGAVWAGSRLFNAHSVPRQTASSAAQISLEPAASRATPAGTAPVSVASAPTTALAHPMAAQTPKSSLSASSALHQEIPNVSRSARESIHGHIQVTVRVNVDRAGNVVHESLEQSGSSKYFARVAAEAARKWRFAPADTQRPREWLLRFDFTRGGTTGHATIARS